MGETSLEKRVQHSSQQQGADLRRVIGELAAEKRAIGGRQATLRQLAESGRIEIPRRLEQRRR